MLRRAVISKDELYRYSLSRGWAPGGRVLWIMLNPSRADAEVDDPTIRRCIGLSRSWGYGAMEVVNLFALRATEPDLIRAHANPVGNRNDAFIARALARANSIVAAWGAFEWAQSRADEVCSVIDAPVQCLGVTRPGMPRHPLYARADTKLISFPGATRPATGACRGPVTHR